MAAARAAVTERLVGRVEELRALDAAIGRAVDGGGAVALIAGPAGIGKSRVALEAAERASAAGFQVASGRSYDEDGAPPYWPWIQVLRRCAALWPAAVFDAELAPYAAVVAELVPELAGHYSMLPEVPAIKGSAAWRFRLFDAVVRVLQLGGRAAPLCLVLEDLHWASESSLRLLTFVGRQLHDSPILVLATYRDRDDELGPSHPLILVVAELEREPGHLHLSLQGLDQTQVRELLRDDRGVEPLPALVQAVFEHTDGNPLFVAQVVQLLDEEQRNLLAGGAQHIAGELPVPSATVAVLERRVRRLAPATRSALEVAAVLGRRVSRDLLIALLQWDHAKLTAAMQEGTAAGLVVADVEHPGEHRFSHNLFQQALLSQLGESRRSELHAQVATHMHRSGEAVFSAGEMSHHFAAARSLLGSTDAFRYGLRAGEQALEVCAYADAFRHFQSILAVTEPIPPEIEARARLGSARAALMMPVPRRSPAVSDLIAAFEYFVAAGDRDLALAAATCYVDYTFSPELAAGMLQILRQAIPLAADGPLRLIVEARLALTEFHATGDDEAPLAKLDLLAQQAAREHNSGAAALHIRATRIGIQSHRPVPTLTLAEIERRAATLEAVITAADVSLGALVLRAAPIAMIQCGHAGHAFRHVDRVVTLGDSLGDRGMQSSRWSGAAAAMALGDWPLARRYVDQHLVHHDSVGLALVRAVLELATGDVARAQALTSAVDPRLEGTIAAWRLAAMARLLVHRTVPDQWLLDEARALLARADRELAGQPPRPPDRGFWVAHVRALLTIAEGEPARAVREYASFTRRTLPPFVVPCAALSTERVAGLLAAAASDLDAAVSHLERSVTACRAAGYRPELAWTYFDLARVLADRASRADTERAARALIDARNVAAELGMPPLMGLIADQASIFEPAHRAPPPAGPPLTGRELQVLQLVAAGMTNQQIATALEISTKTVAVHVGNILNKTGCANRAEAAVLAAAQGWLPAEAPGQ